MAFNNKTELIAKEGSVIHQISEKMISIQSGYRPPFWYKKYIFNLIYKDNVLYLFIILRNISFFNH